MATVTVYGLTAVPVARRLGVTRPARARPLLVGGDAWVIDLASTLRSAGLDVIMWAASAHQRDQITPAGLELAQGARCTSRPRQPSHGVVAPYTGAETVFAPTLTRYGVAQRHGTGARTVTVPAHGAVPPGADLLFLIKPGGSLRPATTTRPLTPEAGDTLVLLASHDRGPVTADRHMIR